MRSIQSAVAAVTTTLVMAFGVMTASADVPALAGTAKQKHFKGFVEARKGHSVYVDFLMPSPGAPVLVLLNGLTYRTGIWDSFVQEIQGNGLGILRYDPKGMGETLKQDGYHREMIDYRDQTKDLLGLLNALKLKDPVHLLGLSYGGAIAIQFTVENPKRVASLIPEAPFVAPLESQDKMIRMQIAATRVAFPYNPATDDQLYDYFLKQTIYSTYPQAEPIVLEHPYKLEATFRLVQGIRRFYAKNVVNKLPPGIVHLMVAGNDQYVPAKVHEEFWNQIPATARGSRLIVLGSEHKIPEAVPHYSAEWVKLIINGDKRLSGGRTFEGGAWTGKAVSGSISIPMDGKSPSGFPYGARLDASGTCESLFVN